MADSATTSDAVTITVDGRPVEARPGEMIIAAAERSGLYIPRFCYHPRMKPVGMCRMCLVEVKGPRGFTLQPACFVPVSEGQEIVTESPKVKKAQDGVLEYLLINHPLDCPVCDKGGECPLQDQTISFGPGESRFIEEKRHWAKPISISPLVLLDRERCIQCARCTRFADEIAGDPLIDFVGRGDTIEVNTYPDQPFASYFSGNTVQICPVGALTSTPYRFRARPWDLEQVESTCTTCSVGCLMAVQSSSNRVTRCIGIDSDPVSHSWLCDRGRFNFEALNSEDRLSQPLLRRDGELVPVTWSEALAAAGHAISEAAKLHGPASVALVGGARLPNEDAYAWAKLAKSVIGTDSVDAQLGDGLPAELVLGLPRASIAEACGADAVVLLGPDLKEELPVLYLRLRQATVERHLPIVELSQTGTGMSRYASASLVHRPGEAPAVAAALVAERDPDGPVGGVAAADLAAARRVLAGAERVVVVLGRPSLSEAVEPTARAASVLVGGVPGVRFLSALRRGNVHGALDMGLAPGVLPGRVSLEDGRPWFTEAWGSVPAQRGLDTAGIMAAAAEGRVQALVLLGADPAADFPDRQLADRALAGAGYVVAVDAFLTESSRRADVVLPAAVYAERGGTTTNLEGRVTHLSQKVVPPGVAWPDWIIAVELAARLGADLGVGSLEDIWAEIEAYAPAHHGLTRPVLTDPRNRDGLVVPLEGTSAPVAAGTGRPGGGPARVGGPLDTGGGATQPVPAPIDPTSEPGIGAVEHHGVTATGTAPSVAAAPAPSRPAGGPPPLLGPPEVAEVPSLPGKDSYSLRLVATRRLYDAAVMTQHSPGLAPLAAGPRLHVNPADLEQLGVASGGDVRVHSSRTSFVIPVAADRGVPRGAAWLAFNPPGGGSAALIDGDRPVTDIRVETP